MKKVLLALLLVFVVSNLALAAYVDPMLTDFKGAERVQVIVMMQPGAAHADVKGLGGEKKVEWDIINGFMAEVPVAAVQALAKNPNVKSVTYNREVKLTNNIANQVVRSNSLWSDGYDGSGIKVAVIDTGASNHQDLSGRIEKFVDYVNGYTSTYDDHGHGTHVAGTIGGNGSTYKGMAPNVKFVILKVLAANGSGSTDDIISAVNYAVNYGVDIISMSLGGTPYTNAANDPTCQAVKNAWNAGVAVVIAAGNDGPSYYTIGTPGMEPSVITVGASDDKNTVGISDDTVASFSSRGPTDYDGYEKPDIVAPGYRIISCDNAYSGYVSMNGTSMATPVVAGIIAQLMEAHPTWSNATIKSRLMTYTDSLGYDKWTEGKGLVDAYGPCYY